MKRHGAVAAVDDDPFLRWEMRKLRGLSSITLAEWVTRSSSSVILTPRSIVNRLIRNTSEIYFFVHSPTRLNTLFLNHLHIKFLIFTSLGGSVPFILRMCRHLPSRSGISIHCRSLCEKTWRWNWDNGGDCIALNKYFPKLTFQRDACIIGSKRWGFSHRLTVQRVEFVFRKSLNKFLRGIKN